MFKLHYFDGYGRSEALRTMLAHAKVDYEDCRYSFEQWPPLKPTMVGGSMPNLEYPDGTKIGATNAIMRMIGAKCGYYPEDPMMAY